MNGRLIAGHAVCAPVEDALARALVKVVALLDATPLEHTERANVEAIRIHIARALKTAHELDWEAWEQA